MNLRYYRSTANKSVLETLEALVVRAGVGVNISAAGVPTAFDHESVGEIVGETERKSA